MVAALTVIATLSAALIVWDAYRDYRAGSEKQLVETARAMSRVVDERSERGLAALRALSASPDLARGDFRAFDEEARRVLAGTGAWVVVEDQDGRQRVNTLVPYGRPLPVSVPTERARRWRETRESGVRYSPLFDGTLSKQPTVAVDMLVHVDGQPRYAIAYLTTAESYAHLIRTQQLPEGWLGTLIDRSDRVVARNRDQARFVGAPITEDLKRSIAEAGVGVKESVSLDGVPTLIAFNTSATTGYTFVVAMPRTEASALLADALRQAALVTVALLVAGAVLAFWIATSLARAIGDLAEGASALGAGGPVEIRRTGMAETDAVARALAEASDRLKAREEELRRLNEGLEARVAEAAENLVQARKLEAVGRLTGGVAHDFNNLLTAVLGNLELLSRRVEDPKLARLVANARQAADRGAKLTAQLLAFSKKQRLDPEPVDLNEVVASMRELLSSTLGGAVRVETSLGADLPSAMADRTQLELVLLNLAINARDAMPAGGRLRVSTDRERLVVPPLKAHEPPVGDYVVLRVADDGHGMTPEVLDRVFEPFFTTKGPGKGSGLGLPQVLGVVQQMGGGVRVESEPDRGSTFSVYLPAWMGAARTPGDATPALRADLEGLKVLLVDDDADVRDSIAALLVELGCEPTPCADGFTALARAGAGDRFDVALVDYAMPGMTGVEFARRLSVARPDVPVVLMSGYLDAAEPSPWLEGALAKPFTPEALRERLARARASAAA